MEHDLAVIKDKETKEFERIINDYPEFKRGIIVHFLKKSWNSDNNSPSIIKCNVTKKENGKRLYSLESVVIYEYLDFLPGLSEAINDTLSKNRIPVLIVINVDKNHDVVFPIAMEYD